MLMSRYKRRSPRGACMDLPQAVSKLKTKKTGAEKKYQCAVPDEAAGGQQHCRCLYVSIWKTGSKKQKKRSECMSLSNGAGILDIDLTYNTRCNPPRGEKCLTLFTRQGCWKKQKRCKTATRVTEARLVLPVTDRTLEPH